MKEVMNPKNCKGTVKIGLCSGGANNRCCIPTSSPPPTTNPPQTPANDSKCTNAGGHCMNPNTCTKQGGTVKNNLCPGGANNKCCIGKKTNTSISKTNIGDSKCIKDLIL